MSTSSDGSLVWPRPLQVGDKIAVVSPSGPVSATRLALGCAHLRSLGLDVQVGPHALETEDYLAGSDRDRADDFTAAWGDDGVRAVVAARGGYGAMRMVDLVDWERLRSAVPKLLVGYSDITVLHLAVGRYLGVASVYGPMAADILADEDADSESVDRFTNMLFGHGGQSEVRGVSGTGGRVVGPLHGGCLTLLASVVGSSLAEPPPGAVVFLEDVDEEPYRIDRMLTQLLRAGWFRRVAGLALGTWTRCGEEGAGLAAVLERLAPLQLPTVTGLPAGHGPLQASLPLGRIVELDGEAAALWLPAPS